MPAKRAGTGYGTKLGTTSAPPWRSSSKRAPLGCGRRWRASVYDIAVADAGGLLSAAGFVEGLRHAVREYVALDATTMLVAEFLVLLHEGRVARAAPTTPSSKESCANGFRFGEWRSRPRSTRRATSSRSTRG